MYDIYQQIIDDRKNRNSALCIVVNTKGSTPRKPGAKMIVYDNGDIYGTIGGGELEKAVIKNALEQIKKGETGWFRHDLVHQHNMCCGGTVDVYIEPVLKKNKLYIFGSGHTGQALARYASDFDFEVVLIDSRKEYLDQFTAENVSKMHLPFDQALSLLPFDNQTYVCIMTYSHPVDRDILAFCMKKPHAYLGMIGSERKVEMTKKIFGEARFATPEELSTVDMPMGFDIKAEGPGEIALSIISKLISVKNKITV